MSYLFLPIWHSLCAALGYWKARGGIARMFSGVLGYLFLFGTTLLLYVVEESRVLAELPLV